MYYYLYQITNNLNGNIYVGVHATDNLDDGYMGSGKRLNTAKKKYGKENFTKEILQFFDNSDEMFLREAEIVNIEFVSRRDTYNIKEGGLGNSSHDSLTLWKNEEYRNKVISKSLSKFWNDPEHKAKLQKIYQSDSYKEKLRAATKISSNYPDKILKTSISSKERWSDPDYKENMSIKTQTFMKGTKVVHHNELKQNKKVKMDDLDQYLNDGWVLGFNSSFKKTRKPRHKALTSQ